MGITGLYDIIGDGEIWSLAAYAARHFEQHGRPLRIAVDGAGWRFENLNPEQVEKIRDGEPAANPVEKTILWRILRLLKLNIQLIFVNDGPRRPWKRDKRGGALVDRTLLELTKKMLRQLKVPYHEAPGEAEAECARLQTLDVVDAVWSDDGDSLMFGCKTLIRQHKIGNKRVKDYIRVYEASTLWKKYGLDSDGLVLFALLSGGDYNTAGLRGCGPKTAHRLAMTYPELSQDLRNTTKILLPQWRMQLQSMLLELRSDIDVPANFPEWRPLDYYRNPTVSANGQLLKLRGLRQDWDRSVKQAELRIFLQKHFNFTTREFLKHIAPIFVISRLARVMPDQRVSNIELGIELKRSRKRKDETDNVDDRTEAKVKFSPLSVVDIDLSQCPVEEDWTGFAAKDGTPYDPVQKVECEILHCFLKNGLPEGALEYATPAKRKRKEQELQSSSTSTPTKRRKTASVDSDPGAQVVSSTVDEGTLARDGRNATSKKRGRPRKDPSDPAKNKNSAITKAKDSRGDVPDDPPLAVFRQPRALLDLRDSMIGSRAADEVSAASLRVTERLYSVPEPPLVMPNSSHSTNQNQSENSIPRLVPGETIPPETLRQIRATAFLAKGSSSCSPQQSSKLNFPKPALAPLKHYEVIDLT